MDNLPPLPPAPAAATYASGTTSLHWSPNHEADLASYRVYRSSSPSFSPAPSNRVASPTDTTYADAAGSPFYYKISAVDAHGNESAYTSVTPAGALAVPDASPRALAFSLSSRNPARDGARFQLATPRTMTVRLALYDAEGRRVRVLTNGALSAGTRSLRWEGDDDAGRALPSGLYFARLEADGQVVTRTIVLQR